MISNIIQSTSYSGQTAVATYLATNSINTSVGRTTTQIEIPVKRKTESVRVTLSEEALRQLSASQEKNSTESTPPSPGQETLSSEEMRELSDLKTRDREVRAHEMAHVMAGAGLVRKGASYQYETGPDGMRYAVSGEVSIDTSPVEDDPAATIRKMQQVKRAALAPAEPSPQDRSVASTAMQIEAQARQDLMQQTMEDKKNQLAIH